MNAEHILFISGIGLIVLPALWWLFAFEYERYRVDLLRYRLFCVRDKLFQEAASGRTSFQSPDYQCIRKQINAMIRYAHTLTLLELIAFELGYRAFVNRAVISEVKDSLVHASMKEGVLDEANVCYIAVKDAHSCCRSHIVYTNVFLFPLALVGRSLQWVVPPLKKIRDMMINPSRAIWAQFDAVVAHLALL